GADEEEAAAPTERCDDGVHGRRDLTQDARHGAHGPAILAVHQRGDPERCEAVEGAARAVLLLGGEPRVANSRRRHVRMLLLSGGCPPSDAGSRSSSTTSRHSSKAAAWRSSPIRPRSTLATLTRPRCSATCG